MTERFAIVTFATICVKCPFVVGYDRYPYFSKGTFIIYNIRVEKPDKSSHKHYTSNNDMNDFLTYIFGLGLSYSF